jgi:hypothetical protein
MPTPVLAPKLAAPAFRPRYASIRNATAYSAICRSRLYELAGQHRGLFRKNGSATVVDLNVLDDILDGLPLATIKG